MFHLLQILMCRILCCLANSLICHLTSFSPFYKHLPKSLLHPYLIGSNCHGFKVIPLKLFYYQTFFETWRNEHS